MHLRSQGTRVEAQDRCGLLLFRGGVGSPEGDDLHERTAQRVYQLRGGVAHGGIRLCAGLDGDLHTRRIKRKAMNRSPLGIRIPCRDKTKY